MVFQGEEPTQGRIKPDGGEGATSVVRAKGPGNFQGNMLQEGQEPTLDAQLRRKGNCLGVQTIVSLREATRKNKMTSICLFLLQKVVI